MKIWRDAALLAGAAVLAAVFAAYLKPDVAMTLASQLWACL